MQKKMLYKNLPHPLSLLCEQSIKSSAGEIARMVASFVTHLVDLKHDDRAWI